MILDTLINNNIYFHHFTGQQTCFYPHLRIFLEFFRQRTQLDRLTSSNTGVNNGSCTILQNLLHQQLLWLARRHHILELIIEGVFTTIFGVTSGPEVTKSRIMWSPRHDSWSSPTYTSHNTQDSTSRKLVCSWRATYHQLEG